MACKKCGIALPKTAANISIALGLLAIPAGIFPIGIAFLVVPLIFGLSAIAFAFLKKKSRGRFGAGLVIGILGIIYSHVLVYIVPGW